MTPLWPYFTPHPLPSPHLQFLHCPQELKASPEKNLLYPTLSPNIALVSWSGDAAVLGHGSPPRDQMLAA